jgi:hypothetical protein
LGRVKEIRKATRIVISTPATVQRKDPFQLWEIKRIKNEYLLERSIVGKGGAVLIDAGYLMESNKVGPPLVECRIIEAEPNVEEVEITPKTKVEIKHNPL